MFSQILKNFMLLFQNKTLYQAANVATTSASATLCLSSVTNRQLCVAMMASGLKSHFPAPVVDQCVSVCALTNQ